MKGRGEKQFRKFPRVAAWIYDLMFKARPIHVQYEENAQDLTTRMKQGGLLDVDTGSGRLLIEVNRLNPDLELFGFDISESMIRRARKNLADIRVDLQQGSIESTDYESDFFDVITCSGSFYLWDHPVDVLKRSTEY